MVNVEKLTVYVHLPTKLHETNHDEGDSRAVMELKSDYPDNIFLTVIKRFD